MGCDRAETLGSAAGAYSGVDILVQQCSAYYAPLLKLTERRHRAYAERFGFQYQRYEGQYAPRDWHRYWDGWTVCQWLLEADCRWLIWIDADALIVSDEDLRIAEINGVGVVRHPGPPPHWNVGVMVIRNSERVRAFWQAVIDRGPGEYPWYQQQIANELWETPEWSDLVYTLPDRYNSTWDVNWVGDAVIRAWHGTPTPQKKAAQLRAYLVERRNQMGVDRLGFTKARLDLLRAAGIRTIEDVERTGTGDLMGIPGVGRATVELMRRRVGELV